MRFRTASEFLIQVPEFLDGSVHLFLQQILSFNRFLVVVV